MSKDAESAPVILSNGIQSIGERAKIPENKASASTLVEEERSLKVNKPK